MNVLFLVPRIHLAEPCGILQLSSIIKKHGHKAKLVEINKHMLKAINAYKPDIIAYSVMSADLNLIRKTDEVIKKWFKEKNLRIIRIMGGPHPTYFPKVLDELQLDAICIGEGDNAIIQVLDKIDRNEEIRNIPNILTRNYSIEDMPKELIQDLDELPFLDREIYYEAAPLFKKLKFRGVMTSRGCPYSCSYCYNHSLKKIFKGCGKIVRRRSVDNVIEEIKYIQKKFQPVEMIRFQDDTFAHLIDDWLLDFLKRYKKEINLPFYCLMRSNVFSEEMAKLLSTHGCISIGMAVESGVESIRNNILKRNLTDEVIVKSFEYANKYGIKTYGNTLLAIPGGTFEDDLRSYLFTKKLKLTVPTFGILVPFQGTEVADFAVSNGLLEVGYNFDNYYTDKSPINTYTDVEKDMQLNMNRLGTLFCNLPDYLTPLFFRLIRIKTNIIFKYIRAIYLIYKVGKDIFPNIYLMNPCRLFSIFLNSLSLMLAKKKRLHE